MTPDQKDLLAAAVQRYAFRAQRPREPSVIYEAEALDFVEQRDWAAAHEVRIGKRQADWTPAEVQGFHDRLDALPRSGQEFGPGIYGYEGLETKPGTCATTEAGLRRLANGALDMLRFMREADSAAQLPILANVVLVDGSMLTALVSSHDRIAFLHAMAQTRPVYGYVLVFDAFVHEIGHGHAVKREAVMAQIGTRELRLSLIRTYDVVDGRAVWDAPTELNLKEHGGEDPYASIFVTVPLPTGAPS